MKIKIEDKRTIKTITFKHPELMGPDAEVSIRDYYTNLLKKEDELHTYRDMVRKVEEDLKVLKEGWENMLSFIDVEFGIKESEYKTEKANFSVFGCGNDSYGSVSYNK